MPTYARNLCAAALLVAPLLLSTALEAQPVPRLFRVADCTAIDGDTLRCGDTRIRLLGIDAAEMPGHCNPRRRCAPGNPVAQRAALSEFAARSPLTVKSIKFDQYERLVAIVINKDGDNASCVMLRAGARYVAAWDDGDMIKRACRI